MRPKAIDGFEALFGAGLLIPLAATLWGTLQGESAAVLDYLGLAVLGVLAFFASRRRSNVTRWILTVLSVLGVLGALYLAATSSAAGADGAVGLAASVLQIAGVAMLWTKSAREWFAERGVTA